jgi:NitT/TauT family transport system permease protein
MAQVFVTPHTPSERAASPPFAWWVDVLLALVVAALAYGIVSLASRWAQPLTPSVAISLSPTALPGYAALSTLRMAIAYVVAVAFSIVYARLAASSRRAERVMIPLLDILQSIPILSFMPGIVLGLVALFPRSNLGLELAAIVLIFTSQAWNIAFGFHQALVTIPRELSESATIYRLSLWDRFTRLELPFGAIPLIWNSMLSWAGGWFFLMASEQFTLGDKDFRVPGLGSYLQSAANAGNIGALFLGLGTLVIVVVLLDQLLWRPLVAWSERFKFEQTEAAETAHSAILMALRRSAALHWLAEHLVGPASTWLDRRLSRRFRRTTPTAPFSGTDYRPPRWRPSVLLGWIIGLVILGATFWGASGAVGLLASVGSDGWAALGVGALATFGRTAAALAIGAAWTVPVGVLIGMNPRWAHRIQPLVQVVASIPATALFPALLLILLGLPGGLELAAVALMLLGTQWYILFNVIAGAMAMPTDLREAAAIYKLTGWRRWRTLILPGIFPYLITGLITATGGAWNASIVAEYVTFGNQTYQAVGLGAAIAAAANAANFPVLLAGTLLMAAIVIAVNRLLWRRLYRLAEQRYRLD